MLPPGTPSFILDIYRELKRAENMLTNGDSKHAHLVTLQALKDAYRLIRPHTRADDTLLPWPELKPSTIDHRKWESGAGRAAGMVEEALSIVAQLAPGNSGFELWNELAAWVVEALEVL